MKKRSLGIICTGFLLAGASEAAVSQFRTPVEFVRLCYPGCGIPSSQQSTNPPFVQYGNSQQPYSPQFPGAPAEKRNTLCCSARPWATAYCRFASEAFVCNEGCSNVGCPESASELAKVLSCDDDCPSGERAKLSALWFGKESFRGEEAFGGILRPEDIGCPFNPFLSFSRITPCFEFFEKGTTIGVDLLCTLGCECLCTGLRIGLPYRFIKINVTAVDEEDLKDVVRDCAFEDFRCGIPPDLCTGELNDGDFAYRLDFLATITEYSSLVSPNPTRMSGCNVGDASAAVTPIYLTKRSDESFPNAVQVTGANPGVLALGKVPAQITGPLAIDGSGVDDQSYHFGGVGLDYLGNIGADRDEQRTLFVVPQLFVNGALEAELTAGAKAVKQKIAELVESLLGKGLATEFFCRDCRINLKCDERMSGIGDLWAQLYGGYRGEIFCFYTLWGITFPTGREAKDPRRVYEMPIGNDGHFEIKWGVEGSMMLGPFGLWFDASYNNVLTSTEKKAAPFECSTIRNIGPCIDTDVSWNYWIVRADLAFFHPCCVGFGALFGYELFSKSKDSVSLCTEGPVKDCFGKERALDCRILEEGTDSISHKVRGEIFHTSCYFRAFFGASYVFSGRNVMSEVEAHIGVMATF